MMEILGAVELFWTFHLLTRLQLEKKLMRQRFAPVHNKQTDRTTDCPTVRAEKRMFLKNVLYGRRRLGGRGGCMTYTNDKKKNWLDDDDALGWAAHHHHILNHFYLWHSTATNARKAFNKVALVAEFHFSVTSRAPLLNVVHHKAVGGGRCGQ